MMPTNRRRKSNSKFVDVHEESTIIKQVPFDVLKCHGPYSNRVDHHGSDSSLNSMTDDVKNFSLKEKQGLESTEKSVLPITPVVGLELPRVELSYFDGQPRGYWKFLREFETYVESRVKDDGQRLLYLIHYCKGKANTAIEGCVMLEASSGYKKAKEILKRLFGQAHVIARKTLEDLFKTANVDHSDPEQLTNLAIRMEDCSMVLNQMKYTANLNSLITLGRIVKLLPQVMQAQWADWVDELTEDNREPMFNELTQFIASRARVANSRFGRLANRPRKGHNLKTNCHLQLEQENNSRERTKCSVCSQDHAIFKCPRFLALTVQERWSHAKVNGICFVCLRQGHKVNECKLAKRCNVNGCEKKHHSLLHSENDKPGISNCCGYTKSLISQVCLGMIPVRLKSQKAEIVGYALLDNGSDVTLIKSNCLRSLWLSGDQASVVVETVGGDRTMKVTSAPFEVYSLDRSEHDTIEGALIVARIPGHKPTKSAMNNLVKWPHLSDVPIDSLDSEEVLLLIGCDVPEAHWVLYQRLGGRKNPYAVKTLLGGRFLD
uniref:CCHC-type domain-containing protein n=1 Tax=Schistosoma margrebowiei TaxID=48269 RepID=A0AA84Z6N0_9TREM